MYTKWYNKHDISSATITIFVLLM